MIELLKLCGFKEQEIKLELPRAEKAFNKAGITAPDITLGKERINKYFDLELQGIRKTLRLLMLEFIEGILARDEGKKRIIGGFMAAKIADIGTALRSESRDIFAVNHSIIFMTIMGSIFDKMSPVLESAEQKWLKAGAVTHCSNVKTMLGQIVLDIIPRPDLLVTTGFLCETAPKTLDLLHEVYDIPVYCCDSCQDREMWEYSEASKRVVILAANSYRRLVEKIQEVVGFKITDAMLLESINARKKLELAVKRVRGIIESSNPRVLSAANEKLLGSLNSLMSPDRLSQAVDAANTLYEELLTRIDKGVGILEKGAPRILAICPNHHNDLRLEQLVEEKGINIITTDTNFTVPYGEEPDDPYIKMGLGLQVSMYTSLSRRIKLIIEECQKLKVAGLLNRYHAGCRTVAGDALVIEKAVKKELGIPVLTFKWENFDPRVYDHQEYEQKLEVFKDMLIK
jgi:benzoyl-CoA reductase/2-hydroxyglutaryl-CoA dehydratase subunit BcrC/BadD/HgdB